MIQLRSVIYFIILCLAAVDFMKKHVDSNTINEKDFELNCGVDVSYSPDQIEDAVCADSIFSMDKYIFRI